MPINKPTLVPDWKRLWKSYSVIFSAANILQAVSVTGLSVLGVINVYFAFQLVVGLAMMFGALGLVGRLIDQKKTVTVEPVATTSVEENKEVTTDGSTN